MAEREVPSTRDRGPDGFEEFVVARRAALLRTAYLLTGSHGDAEDLVQAALVKVVPRWRRIADHPEPYVRTVLAREAVTRWRRRRWRETPAGSVPDLPDLAAGTDQPADVGAREDLRRALQGLAPRQRAVVVLRYFEDLTERETAAALGVAVGTVKSQHRDAIARLRRCLPPSDADADDGPDTGPGGGRTATRRHRTASTDEPAYDVTMRP